MGTGQFGSDHCVLCLFSRVLVDRSGWECRKGFDGFGGGVWRFPRSEYMVEVVWIVFVGELERLTASYIRQIRAWAVGQDDVVRRVLMGLRERREEFLCTSTSLR